MCVHNLRQYLDPGIPSDFQSPDKKIRNCILFLFLDPAQGALSFPGSKKIIRGNDAGKRLGTKERQHKCQVCRMTGPAVYGSPGLALHLFERGRAHAGDNNAVILLPLQQYAERVGGKKRGNLAGHHDIRIISRCSASHPRFGSGSGGKENAHKFP